MGAFPLSPKNPLQGHGIVPGLNLDLEWNVGGRIELSSSRVEEVNADHIAILVPMARLQRRPIPRGAVVRASFVHRSRRWRFTTEAIGHGPDGTVDYLALPPAIIDNDRRNSFRLETTIQPRSVFRVILEGGVEREDREHLVPGSLSDISEGGFCLITRETVRPGERLGIHLDLAPAGELIAHAHVQSVETPGRNRLNYRVHCRFASLSRRERDLIARFLMKRQIELRQRGQL